MRDRKQVDDDVEAIRQAIQNAIPVAGSGAEPVIRALHAECSPGGKLYNDERGYMNPALAHAFGELLAQCPAQLKSIMGRQLRILSAEAEQQDAEAIHGYFSLSYANYLVLHRTLMQSMPDEWQNRMVHCLNELEEAFRHVERPDAFYVKAATEREISGLSDEERLACLNGVVEETELLDDAGDWDGSTWSVGGEEVEDWHRVLIPANDPIPHYDRGRARVEPRLRTDHDG